MVVARNMPRRRPRNRGAAGCRGGQSVADRLAISAHLAARYVTALGQAPDDLGAAELESVRLAFDVVAALAQAVDDRRLDARLDRYRPAFEPAPARRVDGSLWIEAVFEA